MKKLKLKMVKLLTRGQSEWQIQPDTDNTSSAQAVSLPLYGLLTRQTHRTMKKHGHKSLPLVININIVIYTYAFKFIIYLFMIVIDIYYVCFISVYLEVFDSERLNLLEL